MIAVGILLLVAVLLGRPVHETAGSAKAGEQPFHEPVSGCKGNGRQQCQEVDGLPGWRVGPVAVAAGHGLAHRAAAMWAGRGSLGDGSPAVWTVDRVTGLYRNDGLWIIHPHHLASRDRHPRVLLAGGTLRELASLFHWTAQCGLAVRTDKADERAGSRRGEIQPGAAPWTHAGGSIQADIARGTLLAPIHGKGDEPPNGTEQHTKQKAKTCRLFRDPNQCTNAANAPPNNHNRQNLFCGHGTPAR